MIARILVTIGGASDQFFNHPFHVLAGSFTKSNSLHSVIKKMYGQDVTNVAEEGGFVPNNVR
jgi:hypothetical protein